MSKGKRHHSKPHGGAVSYAQRLAQQRALNQALADEVKKRESAIIADRDSQRLIWLMVISFAEATGWEPKRIREKLFPVMEANSEQLQEMIRKDGRAYAYEKLRQRAEEVGGVPVRHMHDYDLDMDLSPDGNQPS